MAFSMTDEELKKRIRNGTPIKILAEMNGVSDQTIYNWMKKNGVERPKDEPEKKPTQVVAKVVPVEIKIEVDEDIMVEIANKIRSINDQMSLLSAYKTSWQKIYDVLKAKEGEYGD